MRHPHPRPLHEAKTNRGTPKNIVAEPSGFEREPLRYPVLLSRIVGRFGPAVSRLRARNAAFILSLLLCLGLSAASVYVGMAAIIGAFLAGLALADHSEAWGLRESTHPIMEFLAPFFFVLLGANVDLASFTKLHVLSIAAMVSVLAILSKLIGCGSGAASLGWREALRVGVGMVPRGEVGLIVAAVGLSLHTISSTIYTVVVIMSIVTTLVAPPVLRAMLPGAGAVAEKTQALER